MSSRALRQAYESQRIAADPMRSVFVTANAGSGKTKVLVDRIARLLLEGSEPSAFLCITYTKAAAAEMQRRLFERLGKWCVADDATLADDLEKLGAPGANFSRARELFARALESPGGLKIQTIHAFCERLLARFPLEAGVPPGFDIADEARAAALLAQARADAALAPDAPVHAFRRFATRLHGEALERLLDRLALRRADFHRYALKHDNAVFADAAIKNRHGVRQSAEDFARDFIARQDWDGLRGAAAQLREGSANDQKGAERLQNVLDCVDRGEDIFAACFAFAFKTDGDPRSAFATKATKTAHPMIEQLLTRFADNVCEARDTFNAIERAEDAAAALALALKLDQAYGAAKHRGGVLDFEDLIEHAQALLHRSDAAPWVLYKLDGGLDHILIDEGQDTSPAQWDLIAPLQEEFFSGAGARAKLRTIFAVGDPKQSIYGFQGADPARFLSESQALEKRARRAKQIFSAPDLLTSFRTTPEVLQAVDAVFAARPLIAAAPGRHDVIEHLAARANEHGSVEVWPFVQRPQADQGGPWDAPMDVEYGATVHAVLAKQIAERIKAMINAREAVWDKGVQRAMHAGDVLALVRTRGPLFRELIKAFKREGLPVAGADRMTLRDELAVEDCLALMRVALDPADDLSLACVLKGPWCDLDDDDNDLFPLAYGRDKGETLLDRLNASTDKKYAHAQSFIAELIARRGGDPFSFLAWALEGVHDGVAGWRRVLTRLGLEARDPLEELLQRALKPSTHAAASLQRFLYEIEVDAGQVKRELEAETGAVRVMTVHGAKGLEAPVVILPDSTGDVSDKPDDGLMFDDAGEPYVSFRSKEDDSAVSAARAAHEARMLSEHWRLLYVAMTRARDRLIVCGVQYGGSTAGESEVSWRAATEDALRTLGAEACDTPAGEGLRLGSSATAEALTPPVIERVRAPAWASAPVTPGAPLRSAAPSRAAHADPLLFSPRGDGQKRFRRGRLIHGLLQRLPDVAAEARAEAARNWLLRQSVDADEAETLAGEALRVIEDVRFASLFGPASRGETPIIGAAAGRAVRGIVDRLAVDETRVMVLDFKTDRPAPLEAEQAPAAYVLQMALYREVLRNIFPGRAVSCALLWTEAPRLTPLSDRQLDDALAQWAQG